MNKRIVELNNEVNELEKLTNHQNNDNITILMNRINESDMEMSKCHNNLLEQDGIIQRLQKENNILRDQLRQADNEIQTLNRNYNDSKSKLNIESEQLKSNQEEKNINKELKKIKNA